MITTIPAYGDASEAFAPAPLCVSVEARSPLRFSTITTEEFLLDSKGVVWSLDDEGSRAILASCLNADGRRRAFSTREAIQALAPDASEWISKLDDGGLSMEFTSPDEDRELTFVVPADGSVLYFLARDSRGFRAAGIAHIDAGISDAARWLSGTVPRLPVENLAIG